MKYGKTEQNSERWKERRKKKGRKTTRNDTVKALIYKYMYIIHELRRERNKSIGGE